jgi:hypothetical protein
MYVWRIDGHSYLQMLLVNTTSATVSSSLPGIATIPVYFVKASVMVSTYLLTISDVLQGPSSLCEASGSALNIEASVEILFVS